MSSSLLHVRASLVPGLTASDLEENSFYELLIDRYDIQIAGGTQTVEPTVTNDEESDALGVPLHSPALLFERVTRASTGDVIEFTAKVSNRSATRQKGKVRLTLRDVRTDQPVDHQRAVPAPRLPAVGVGPKARLPLHALRR